MRARRPRPPLTSSIVQAFGGSRALTDKLGFAYQQRVSNWLSEGIPRDWWPELLDLARDEGLPITLEVLREAEAELGTLRCAA